MDDYTQKQKLKQKFDEDIVWMRRNDKVNGEPKDERFHRMSEIREFEKIVEDYCGTLKLQSIDSRHTSHGHAIAVIYISEKDGCRHACEYTFSHNTPLWEMGHKIVEFANVQDRSIRQTVAKYLSANKCQG